MTLAAALGMGKREHVAVVGAGGKTSFMFALAGELRKAGYRVGTTTTTKVRQREALQTHGEMICLAETGWQNKLKHALEAYGVFFAGGSVHANDKLEGIQPESADMLFGAGDVDHLIVEADGAAGHPVKAPEEHEPVVPSSSTLVVAMLGLEALGRRLGPETAFRLERMRAITGLEVGEPMTPDALSRTFFGPNGLFRTTGSTVRQVVFLNKSDLLKAESQADDLARCILGTSGCRIERVVIGSIAMRRYRVAT